MTQRLKWENEQFRNSYHTANQKLQEANQYLAPLIMAADEAHQQNKTIFKSVDLPTTMNTTGFHTVNLTTWSPEIMNPAQYISVIPVSAYIEILNTLCQCLNIPYDIFQLLTKVQELAEKQQELQPPSVGEPAQPIAAEPAASYISFCKALCQKLNIPPDKPELLLEKVEKLLAKLERLQESAKNQQEDTEYREHLQIKDLKKQVQRLKANLASLSVEKLQLKKQLLEQKSKETKLLMESSKPEVLEKLERQINSLNVDTVSKFNQIVSICNRLKTMNETEQQLRQKVTNVLSQLAPYTKLESELQQHHERQPEVPFHTIFATSLGQRVITYWPDKAEISNLVSPVPVAQLCEAVGPDCNKETLYEDIKTMRRRLTGLERLQQAGQKHPRTDDDAEETGDDFRNKRAKSV